MIKESLSVLPAMQQQTPEKTVMVIGSGDAAIEEGMFLTKFADKVIVSVMHENGKMDCNEIAKAQALNNPKWNLCGIQLLTALREMKDWVQLS